MATPKTASAEEISGLYQELLGRPADEAGAKYWSTYSVENARTNIMASDEYKARSASATPQAPSGVAPYINSLQDKKFEELALENSPFAAEATKTNEQIAAETKAAILPTQTAAPAPINMSQMYDEMRGKYGLDNLENQINELSTQIDQETLNITKGRSLEQGKPVALNVIEGRISERDRIQNDKIQNLNLIRDSLTRVASSANAVINTRMQLTKEDYDIAKDAYQTEFNNNLSVNNAIEQKTQYRDDLRFKIMSEERSTATANLQIYLNLASKGQLNFSSLSSDQQLQIGKMETMAGLPVGFLQAVKPAPGEDIKSMTQREVGGKRYMDIIRVDANGVPHVESQFIGNVDVTTTSASAKAATAAATAAQKKQEDSLKAFNADVDKYIKAVQDDPNAWGPAFNTLKSRYGLSNADTDRALGVSEEWIKSGKPGWAYYQQ